MPILTNLIRRAVPDARVSAQDNCPWAECRTDSTGRSAHSRGRPTGFPRSAHGFQTSGSTVSEASHFLVWVPIGLTGVPGVLVRYAVRFPVCDQRSRHSS